MKYCMRNQCSDISSTVVAEIQHFVNQKLEADNAIFFIYNKIREGGSETPVVIDAEDMDILVTSAYVSSLLPGTLGIKQKKGVFDCKQLCTEDMASIAVRVYVMSGIESVSSFLGRGKNTSGQW